MSRSKLLLLFAVAAVVGLVAMASLAGAADRAPTVIKIRGTQGDFHGRITSHRKACLGGRTVKVFKQKGDHQNPKRDSVIAKDTSAKVPGKQVGIWSVGNTGFKHGDFYAKATRTDACKRAYSDTLSE